MSAVVIVTDRQIERRIVKEGTLDILILKMLFLYTALIASHFLVLVILYIFILFKNSLNLCITICYLHLLLRQLLIGRQKRHPSRKNLMTVWSVFGCTLIICERQCHYSELRC